MEKILKKLIAGRIVIVSAANVVDITHILSENYIVDNVIVRNLGLNFSMIIPNSKLIKKIENDKSKI